jgi:hypothetical protein
VNETKGEKVRTIADVQAEIGVVSNPADGRSWYRLYGPDFGDFDTTVGHYRRTNADGRLVLVRDDTMQEITCESHGPGPGGLGSGWRYYVPQHTKTEVGE